MADISAEFVHLRQSAGDASHLITRPLAVRAGGGDLVLIALDLEGKKHLLIPLGADEHVAADRRSQGVWLTETLLGPASDTRRFASLQCRERSLDLVFERLVEDVVGRIANGESTSSACHIALDDWRAMLRSGGGVGRDEIIGLIGELEVLRRMGTTSPPEALRAWTGPRRTVHDFVHGGHAIEVKATSAVDGATVTINGLDQLDPAEVSSLHLAVVHCKLDPSVATVDDRIRRLVNLGFPRDELLEGVKRTGYVFEAEIGQPTTYKVRSLRLWQVGDSFPGLRRSSLPEGLRRGVTRVGYSLSLDSASEPLPDEEAHTFLEGWLLR